jgi:hypothetical protein
MGIESSMVCLIMARYSQPDLSSNRFMKRLFNINGCFVDLLVVFEIKTALNKIS